MPNGFFINVRPYCENCDKFIPEVRSRTFGNKSSGYTIDHEIYCRHSSTCERIFDHLRTHFGKDAAK